MEGLVKKGRVVAGTVTPYMLAGLGVSVRAGAPKPDISTVDAYKATLLAAKSIGYSRGCSGEHAAEGNRAARPHRAAEAEGQLTGGGTGPVTFFLARGDFELGIQQTNIMVGAPGTDFVGPVPRGVEQAVPEQRRAADGLEGAGRRAGDDQVHDLAGSGAAMLRKVHELPAKS